MKWVALVLVSLFAPFLLAQLWAQEPSTFSTPIPTSPSYKETLDKLDSLLTELSTEAGTLSEESEKLKTLLEQARDELKTLSGRLEESRTQANALSSSLKLSAESLGTFADSLKGWERDKKLELWLTRAGVLTALVVGYFGGRGSR